MKNITTPAQDIARHARLYAAYQDTIRNEDADQNDYDSRESKHFDFCLRGSSKNDGKEYFTRSPYATVQACGGGFIVHNVPTGKNWPFATWEGAMSMRGGVSARYKHIETSGEFKVS